MIDRLKTAIEGRYRIERELGWGGMVKQLVGSRLTGVAPAPPATPFPALRSGHR